MVLTALSVAQLEQLKDDSRWRARFDASADLEVELPEALLSDATDYCRDVQTGAAGPMARVVRGSGPFGTDRGVRELPAWMMYPANRRWPFIGLDPEFENRMTWRPAGLQPYADVDSTLRVDGRTLTYRFTGTPAAYASYPRAEVYETETAVLVEPVEVDLTSPDGVRLAYTEVREVVVRLAAPLGNRVLIWPAHGPGSTTFGSPCTVIATSSSRPD